MIRIVISMIFLLALPGVSQAKATAKKGISKPKYEKLNKEVVKASPLNQPESSRMRKKRQQMEMETEEQMFQRLEKARIADEEKRREQFFKQEMAAVTQEDSDETKSEDLEIIEEDLEGDLPFDPPPRSYNQVSAPVDLSDSDDDDNQIYVTLGGGSVSYPVVSNIPDANGAAGFGLGLGLGKDFWLEGGFLYSFQEAEIQSLAETRDEDIDHYTFSAATKYTFGFSNHWVTPVVGLSLNYTRRQFNGGDNNSNAFDGGLIGGIDLALNKTVKLGFEGRYMVNFDYNRDLAADQAEITAQELATGRDVQNIEENDYIVLLLNAKVFF